MSENHWNELQRAWQEPPEELPEIRQLLEKRTWRIAALTGLDIFFTVLLLLWVGFTLRSNPTDETRFLVWFVLFLLAIGWIAVLAIRRGTWKTDTSAPSAMLDLSIRRCVASINLARVNQYGLILSLAVGVALRALFDGVLPFPEIDSELKLAARVLTVLVFVPWFFVARHYKHRKLAELSRLRQIRRDLDD